MSSTYATRLRRVGAAGLAALALTAVATSTAEASVPAGWNSKAYILGKTPYANLCKAGLFYGRTPAGQPYASGTTTSTNCRVKVKVIPGGFAPVASWNNWEITTPFATSSGSSASASFQLEIWIIPLGPATQIDYYSM